jgi:HEAT repeat protein
VEATPSLLPGLGLPLTQYLVHGRGGQSGSKMQEFIKDSMKYRPPKPRSLSASDLKELLAENEGLNLEFKLKYDLSGGSGAENRRGEFAKDIISLANTAGRDANDFAYLVIGAGDGLRADGTRARESIQPGQYSQQSLLKIANAACVPELRELLVSEIEMEETRYAVIILPPSPHVHRFSKDVPTVKRVWSKNVVPLRSGEEIIVASPEDIRLMEKQKAAWSGPHETNDFEYVIPLFAKYTPAPLPSGIRAKRAVRQLLALLGPTPPATNAAETTNDILRLLLEHRHMALEGSSGSGKTTTLRQIESSLRKRRPSETALVPIYIDVHDWLESEIAFHDWFTKYRAEIGIREIPLSQLAVLIDGIQQFDDSETSAHRELVRSISEKLPQIHCVITARAFPLDTITQLDFLVTRLEPLSGAQIESFLEAYLEPTLASEFGRWLSDSEIPGTGRQQLFEDIVRNPLRLSILLSVYSVERATTAHAIGPLLLSFFAIVFEREKANHDCSDTTLDQIIDWIGPIALRLVTNPRIGSFRLDDKNDREQSLERLLIGSEIIAPAKAAVPKNLKFCHTLVRDFFAAKYLANYPDRVGELVRPPQIKNGNRIPTPLDEVLRLLASLDGASQVFSEISKKDVLIILELSLSIPGGVIATSVIESTWPGLCALLTSSSPERRHASLELCQRSASLVGKMLPETYANTGNPALRKICVHLAWYAADAEGLELICRAISDANRTVRREAREIFVSIGNEDPLGAARIARRVIDEFSDRERLIWASSISSVAGSLNADARRSFSTLAPISTDQFNSEKISSILPLSGSFWKLDLDFGALPSEFTHLISNLASCGAKEAVLVLSQLRPFARAHLEEIHVLAESGDRVLARRLPRLMSHVQDPRSIDVLIRLLRFPHPRVIEHALKALSAFRRPDITERVRQFCYSPESRVRIQAVRLMVSQGEMEEHLLLSFLRDRYSDIRHAAVLALGRKGTEQSAIRSLDLLSDPAEAVRIAVCQNAVRAGLEGVKRIRSCLTGDPSVHVRRQALKALIAIDPDEGLSEATTLLYDPCSPDLLAATALEALLRETTEELREQVVTFSRTLPGARVQKVIREWLGARENHHEIDPRLSEMMRPTPVQLLGINPSERRGTKVHTADSRP